MREEAEKIMWDLVRLMKTQKAVARALGQSKQTFNYWFNHAKKVPYEQLLAMQRLLEKKRQQHTANVLPSLQPIASSLEKHPAKTDLPESSLTLSQQVKLAMQFEKAIGQRRGRRAANSGQIKAMSRTGDSLIGRTDVLAAKKFGFTSKDTYLRAKKVVLSNNPELIQAMDEQRLTIYHAAQLSTHSPSAIHQVLAQGKPAVIAFLKKKPDLATRKTASTLRWLNLNIFHNEQLIQAEHRFQLPLRSALVSLLASCDNNGKFAWSSTQLKTIFPYIGFDVEQLKAAFCECGLIQEQNVHGEIHWYVPLIKQFVREQEVDHAEMDT